MQEYLQKYFAIHNHASLPGIGFFCVQEEPAQLDFINKNLYPPLYKIVFNAEEDGSGDEKFYHFLSKEKSMSESEVKDQFLQFSSALKNQLELSGNINLYGFGTLEKNETGYSLSANTLSTDFFPVVNAERVIRQNAEHNVKVGEDNKTSTEMQQHLANRLKTEKDRWWIGAIVLAVIGVAAIAYFYYSKHS